MSERRYAVEWRRWNGVQHESAGLEHETNDLTEAHRHAWRANQRRSNLGRLTMHTRVYDRKECRWRDLSEPRTEKADT